MTDTHAPAGTPLVELRDIRVSFGGLHAVDGVSMALHPGEVMAVVGGNGAGKSTLMHTIAGAHPADSGQILVNGKPVTIANPRDARAHGIEVIYQRLALAAATCLTAAEQQLLLWTNPAPTPPMTRPRWRPI